MGMGMGICKCGADAMCRLDNRPLCLACFDGALHEIRTNVIDPLTKLWADEVQRQAIEGGA